MHVMGSQLPRFWSLVRDPYLLGPYEEPPLFGNSHIMDSPAATPLYTTPREVPLKLTSTNL